MVRRWSYINEINKLSPATLRSGRLGAFNSTFRLVTYWRKPFFLSTKHIRRRWARRKHLYSWLSLSNVIKDWSYAYKFQRNFLKAVFYQHLSPNSFFTFNLLNAKNSIPALHKGSELVVLSSCTKKILTYFTRFNNPRIHFILSIKNWSFSVMSYKPSYWTFDYEERNSYVTPIFLDSFNSVFHTYQPSLLKSNESITLLRRLWSFATQSVTSGAKHIYKILILTLLAQIFTKQKTS